MPACATRPHHLHRGSRDEFVAVRRGAPAARMPVAAVCRNRCAPMTASPAGSQARATTWLMPLGDKPSHGPSELRNRMRQPPIPATVPTVVGDRRAHVDRQRQQFTVAALAGHHRLSDAPVDVVDRQGRHLATPQPQARQHRQIAKSRRPVPVRRSQPSNIRATSSPATARTTPRSRQPGATGTASTNGADM